MCNPDASEAKLYNLREDVGEKINLASKRSDIAHRLQHLLLEWWSEMNTHYDTPTAKPASLDAK